MRVLLVAAGLLTAALQAWGSPLVPKEAARYGLAGEPSSAPPPTMVKGRVVKTRRDWTNAAGHRWEIVEYDRKGAVKFKFDGLQLANGRYLVNDEYRGRIHRTSEWTWGKTKVRQSIYAGSRRYKGSTRISGNGVLHRMSSPKIKTSGGRPLRFTMGGSNSDWMTAIEAMLPLAKRRARAIALNLGYDKDVLAHPNEPLQAILERARADGAVPFSGESSRSIQLEDQ